MRFITVILVLIVLATGVTVGLAHKRWEGQAPVIHIDREFKALGRSPSLKITVADAGTGLKNVAIRLQQGDQDVVLAQDAFPKAPAEKSKVYDVGKLIVEKFKMQTGPATLTVTASDHALRNF